MRILWCEDYLSIPGNRQWDFVERLRIRPIVRETGPQHQFEYAYEIEFEDFVFQVRKFAIRQNRKFRQVIYENTEAVTAPVKTERWNCIIDQALQVGYRGPNADDYANRKKARADEQARGSDLFHRVGLT